MKIPTGADFLDNFLAGGYDKDIITTIYGPSGSGKTNLCLLAVVRMAETGKKIIFIDTEGGIAVERIRQLSKTDEVLKNIMFISPLNFIEQRAAFENLKELVTEDLGMIVVDSISMLYRLELGKSDDVYEVNNALGRQIASLVEIARSKGIPVLMTNQVYADFGNKEQVKMVGGDLLKYGSKCLLELKRFRNCRGIILQKHRFLPDGKELKFKIVEKGIEEVV